MPSRSQKQMSSDFWLGLGIAAGAGIGIVLIRAQVGPLFQARSILPLVGAGGCLILGLCLALHAYSGQMQTSKSVESGMTSMQMMRLTGAIAVIILHAIFLKYLGLVVAGISLQVMLLTLVGSRNIMAITLLPLASVAALYFGISILLGVPLPEGLLWQGG